VRLNAKQLGAIRSVFSDAIANRKAELYLHGSRTDDSKKGGDIDLLLLTADTELLAELREKKFLLLVRIEALIGEQKIDLLLASPGEAKMDPFLKNVLPSALMIKQWEGAA